MISTSIFLPALKSPCMLLPIPGMARIFCISWSIKSYSNGTSHLRATSITSRINSRVIIIALGDELSHDWVSSNVRVVREFHAAFHTTFSQRFNCISSSMSNGEFPAAKSVVNNSNCSSSLGLFWFLPYKPSCVCSDFVCLTTPGTSWLAPTQVLLDQPNFEKKKGFRWATYYTCDDCTLRECFPEWFLVANTILYDNERRTRFIHDRWYSFRNWLLINGLVSTHNIVIPTRCLWRILDHYESLLVSDRVRRSFRLAHHMRDENYCAHEFHCRL